MQQSGYNEASAPHASPKGGPTVDMQEFVRNRQRFPAEELEKYAGTYVAWTPDDSRILANDEDELRLDITVRQAGYDPADVLVFIKPCGDGARG